MQRDLIIDVGMHNGEDTAFYLKKGFRVVAVEANPALVRKAEKRLAPYLKRCQLTIVEAAIVEVPGPTRFFAYEKATDWSTTQTQWVERNLRMGVKPNELVVAGINFQEVLDRYGTPYFLKIDIEGNDELCLQGLIGRNDIPDYVSIESSKTSWKNLRREFALLRELGYSSFKVVNQVKVPKQIAPDPPLEGNYVSPAFRHGASGLFGEEAPGRWMPNWRAILFYRWVFLKYWLVGNDGLFANLHRRPHLRNWPRLRQFLHPGWYDTHAKR